jgi:hypothetical protein
MSKIIISINKNQGMFNTKIKIGNSEINSDFYDYSKDVLQHQIDILENQLRVLGFDVSTKIQ